MNNGKKRIFIILGLVTALVYAAIFGALWLLVSSSSDLVRQITLIGLMSVFVLLLLGAVLGIGGLVFGLLWGKESKQIQKISRHFMEISYPGVVRIGKFLGIAQEDIQDSYIKINNQMAVASGQHFAPSEILILAPHCLQKTDCPHKITIDVQNCHRCGRCSVNGLLNIAEENGVKLVVASGGTFARKLAKEYKPKAIVAIACERDLTSGIRDMKELPVVGVLNERPNGPCYNTTVQLCKVQQAINYFLRTEEN